MSVVILPRLVGAMEICWGAKPKVDTREHNNSDMIALTKIASIPSCLGHFFFCVLAALLVSVLRWLAINIIVPTYDTIEHTLFFFT
jgi:hypothetical protein